MISKIDHINIVVRDLTAAENFFADIGFVTKRRGTLEGEWIETLTALNNVTAEYVAMVLPGDTVALELLKFQSPPGERDDKISSLNQVGFRHIAFQVKDIEGVVANFQQRGVKFLSAIRTYEPLSKKLCYCTGPEGIVLELAQYS